MITRPSRWTFGHHNPSVRWGYYFLSGRTDPAGHTTVFQYDSSATNMVALRYVIDPSGGTNTISRNTAGNKPYLITGVQGPQGETVTLTYDQNDQLVSITDAVGIVSEMGGHDANGWPAWVRTPYGTTHFHFSDVWLERTITIRHPDGGREAYGLYDLVSTNLIPSHFTSMPVSPLGTLENGYRNHANTLHWNRQQFPQLTTTNLIALGAGDFRRGRLRHWLNIPGYQGDYSHADTIAHEQ